MTTPTKSALGVAVMLFSASGELWALPSYRRLWERKYGYKMSCVLCHAKGGGSERTPYGHDFQRFGMTPGAFKSIEKRDSDGDGYKNLAEILAKSNPGDSRSTPENLTDWLERIEEAMLPMEQLEELFPGIKKFSSLEGTLLESQIERVEKSLGRKLPDEDTVPTFYFAVEKSGDKLRRTGVSIFVTPAGGETKLITAVGMDLSGKITKVLLVKNKEDKRLSDESFLSQFSGRTVDDPLAIGKDLRSVPKLEEGSELVARSVKKALLIIQAVFSRQ